MGSRGETVARGVEACKQLAGRYMVGFTDETRVAQPPGLPNHVAWSLGHMAMTMHRVAEKIDGGPLPDDSFGPQGFQTESVAFGSMPVAESGKYPPLARCIAIYELACDRLAAALRSAPDAKLDEKIAWGPAETTLESLAMRMIFHNGMHTGEIADARRALKMKSIFA